MEDRIEHLDRLRRRMLLGFVAAYVAWRLPQIGMEALDTALPNGLKGVLVLMTLVGSVVWIVYLVRLMIFCANVAQRPALATVLNDERVRGIWPRAFAYGFWAVMLLLAVASALPAVAWAFTASGAVVTERVGAVVADTGLLVGIVTAIVVFLVLDRG